MNKEHSDLCENIKDAKYWDEIFVAPAPCTPFVTGYRINITDEPEEEVRKAKKILSDALIFVEDRKATSYSKTVQPGNRTLRVIHQQSVTNLRRILDAEKQRHKQKQ